MSENQKRTKEVQNDTKSQEEFQEHDKKIILVFNAIKELLGR